MHLTAISRGFRRHMIVLTAMVLSLSVAGAQVPTAPEVTVPASDESRPQRDPIAALDSVLDSIHLIEKQLSALSADLGAANPTELPNIETQLKNLSERREVLLTDFESIATGINPADYDRVDSKEFALRDELDKLIRPLVEELKDLTEKPREIEQFRSELGTWQRRRETAQSALANLEALPVLPESGLAEPLGETRRQWDERLQLAENRIQALSYQLAQAQEDQPGLYTAMRDAVRDFFRSRGRNTLLCLLAFIATFVFLRFLHGRINRFTPWVRKGIRPFYVRLVDVCLSLFSLVGAGIAAMLVIYATGDWVLMGFALIVLLGLALAAKSGIPKVYNHARLLLNLGEIREGERVVYNGIPWRVEHLSFFSTLTNEKLRGGSLRLPIRQLGGLLSRPVSPAGEAWFPSDEGDWIELPSMVRGRVVTQTPEFVQLVKLGGAKVTIPTAEYLESAPTNLSQGFRISVRLGIAYKHLAEATTSIPETLWAHLTREMHAVVDAHDQLRNLKVEFSEASPSSLDYAIIADFDGSLAARHDVLERLLRRHAVDCCHAHGWELPLPQITVHRAEA